MEKLSGEAQALIHRMLDQGAISPAIARAVQQRTGERITRSSIGRYAARYRAGQEWRQEARRRTKVLLERVREQGCQISEMLRAAFLETFTDAADSGTLLQISPLQWEAAERKRQELAFKERQLLLSERRAKVFEQRLELDRAKAQAALDQLDRKARAGEPLSPDDVRRIREIYGLYDDEPPQADDSEPEPSDENPA